MANGAIDKFKRAIFGREPIDVISQIPQQQRTPRVQRAIQQTQPLIQQARQAQSITQPIRRIAERITVSPRRLLAGQTAGDVSAILQGQTPEQIERERPTPTVRVAARTAIPTRVEAIRGTQEKRQQELVSGGLSPGVAQFQAQVEPFVDIPVIGKIKAVGPAAKKIPKALSALAKQARKLNTFQEFEESLRSTLTRLSANNQQGTLLGKNIRAVLGRGAEDFFNQAKGVVPDITTPVIPKLISPENRFKQASNLAKGLVEPPKGLVPRGQVPIKPKTLKPTGRVPKIHAPERKLPTKNLVGEEKLSLGQRTTTPDPNIRSSQEVLTIDKNITAKEKVNLFDLLRTPTTVLEKMGLGAQAKSLDQSWTNYKVELPAHLNQITDWLGRLGTKDSQLRAFRILDGQKITPTPLEKQVTDEIRVYLKDWADRLGLKEENRIANYITRLFEDQFITKEFDPDLAKAISGKVAGSVYNPFLQKRLGVLGYKENLGEALQAYVKRASRKVHMDPALEALKKQESSLELSQSKYVANLTDRINMRPTDMDQLLDNGIRAVVGNRLGIRPTARLSSTLRQITYRGTLGLNIGSAVRNLTQGVNTFAKLGTRWTAKGYTDLMKHMASGDWDELIKNGVLDDQFIDVQASALKRKMATVDKGLFFFFEKAEQINRGSAYFGGKARALAKGKSLEEAIKEGVELARVTQFKFGPVQTPPLLQSDINKFLFQFQSFNVKQAEFLADLVKNKEWTAIMRQAIGATLVTATFGKLIGVDAEDWVPFLGDVLKGETRIGKTPTIELAKIGVKAAVGAPGKFGQPIGAADIGKGLVPFVPGGTQARKSIKGLKALETGASISKTGLVRFPVTDPKAAVFGEFQNEVAQFYFDNDLTPLGEKDSAAFKSRVKSGEEPNKVFFDLTAQRTARSKKTPEEKTELLKSLREILGIQEVSAASPQETDIQGIRSTTRETNGLPFPDFNKSAPGQKLRADLNISNSTNEVKNAEIVFHMRSPDGEVLSVPQTTETINPGESFPFGLQLQVPDNAQIGPWDVWATINGEEITATRKTHEVISADPVDRYARDEQNRTLTGIDTNNPTFSSDETPTTTGRAFETAKQEKETFEKVTDLLDSGLAEEDINQQIGALGVSQEDSEYFAVARLNTDLKTAFVKDFLDTGATVDQLVQLRREVGGDKILTSTVIDDLFNSGLVTSEEKKFLKSIVDIDGQLQPKPTAPKKAKKPKKLPKITVRAPTRKAITLKATRAPRAPRIKVPKIAITSQNRARIIAKTNSVAEFKRALLKAR